MRDFRFLSADVNPAPMPKLNPPFLLELAVSGADCVGVEAEASGKFSGARQPLPGSQIIAQDPQHDLGDQLLPDADFAPAREPELHATILGGQVRVDQMTNRFHSFKVSGFQGA